MKFDKKKIIILVSILLICILVFVLVFLFKKTSNDNNYEADNDILSCVKQTADKYKIQVETKYKNNKVNSIKYTFTNNSSVMNGTEEYINKVTDTKILLDYLATLVGTDYYVSDNVSTVVLSNETKDYYKSEQLVKDIFGVYDKVRDYYENDGYTCK